MNCEIRHIQCIFYLLKLGGGVVGTGRNRKCLCNTAQVSDINRWNLLEAIRLRAVSLYQLSSARSESMHARHQFASSQR